MDKQKLQPAAMFGRSSILILMQILTFVDKKRTKKLINLNGLVTKMQQALNKRSTFTLYYVNNYFVVLLNLLKKQGYIFNYFLVPVAYFASFLKFGFKEDFYSRVALIYFSGYKSEEISLKRIKLTSKPSRQIYITYATLSKLVPYKNVSCTYILNTTKGLISHTEALQYKIGGNLVCAIY